MTREATPEQIERYYRGGQKVIVDWLKDHGDDLDEVKAMGEEIYQRLEDALADENSDPLWIARCKGELSRLD